MKKWLGLFVLFSLLPNLASALVSYDEGRMMIGGIQLLQDVNDKTVYYYIPQYPRLAKKANQEHELLMLKYTDSSGGTSGGLLHALVEFTLPQDVITDLEKELKKTIPNARIVGPVPLMEAVDDGQEGVGSFQVISAILSDKDIGGFTRSVITSGHAPLAPGSKAVVAAILNPQGASLLWESLNGPASDVSVSVSAYYEAAVKGYNAKVTANVETVYQHFSRVYNVQKDYSKRQLRKVMDELQQTGDLKVEVLDRTQGLGIKAKDMEGILSIVTDKLVDLMFDHKTGWAKEPKREVAVEANQIQGRQKRGWFSRVFGGAQDTKYFTDDQYVLKRRQDIRRRNFTITLGKSSTIKVPVNTAGNLGGLYQELRDDQRYFRVVNLEDPAFQTHPVHFQVDGGYLDSFQTTVNFVSVNFRKTYPNQPAFTRAVQFTHEDIKQGKTMQDISFARLGIEGPEWLEYEYQTRWSLRDGPTVAIPKKEDKWIKTRESVVALVPPFQKRVVEIDADRSFFNEYGYSSAVVKFAHVLAGKKKKASQVVLRASDAKTTSLISLYTDRDTPVAYQITWHSPKESLKTDLMLLDSDYLFIVPPEPQEDPVDNDDVP